MSDTWNEEDASTTATQKIEAKARADEAEKCCRDVCVWCRKGQKVILGNKPPWVDMWVHDFGGLYICEPCMANHIRQRRVIQRRIHAH